MNKIIGMSRMHIDIGAGHRRQRFVAGKSTRKCWDGEKSPIEIEGVDFVLMFFFFQFELRTSSLIFSSRRNNLIQLSFLHIFFYFLLSFEQQRHRVKMKTKAVNNFIFRLRPQSSNCRNEIHLAMCNSMARLFDATLIDRAVIEPVHNAHSSARFVDFSSMSYWNFVLQFLHRGEELGIQNSSKRFANAARNKRIYRQQHIRC